MPHNPSNIFWVAPSVDTIDVGFTKEFLDSLGTIWAFIPSESSTLVVGRTFANIESGRKLLPLKSPLGGEIVKWNQKFLEYPDKIVSTEYILKVKQ